MPRLRPVQISSASAHFNRMDKLLGPATESGLRNLLSTKADVKKNELLNPKSIQRCIMYTKF